MKAEPEVEMREEYDFSGGVRGRLAARFTPEEREEMNRLAAVQDVHTWLAHSLLQVQFLEAVLFVYLVLANGDSPEQAAQTAAALLDARKSRELPYLVDDLRERGLSGDEFHESFQRVMKERDWLVHRGGIESQSALSEREKTLALLDRLERIAAEATALRVRVEELIEQRLAPMGLSKQEIDRKREETVDLWLAAA